MAWFRAGYLELGMVTCGDWPVLRISAKLCCFVTGATVCVCVLWSRFGSLAFEFGDLDGFWTGIVWVVCVFWMWLFRAIKYGCCAVVGFYCYSCPWRMFWCYADKFVP